MPVLLPWRQMGSVRRTTTGVKWEGGGLAAAAATGPVGTRTRAPGPPLPTTAATGTRTRGTATPETETFPTGAAAGPMTPHQKNGTRRGEAADISWTFGRPRPRLKSSFCRVALM